MIRHRIITERLLENIQKHNTAFNDHELHIVLTCAPKIQNGCILVNNSTDTLLQSLINLAKGSNFTNKRIVEYLLDFSQHIFNIKINNQTLPSKHYQPSEVLEFKIIHNINKFLDHFLRIEETKVNASAKSAIKSLVDEKMLSTLLRFLEGISDKTPLEQTLQRNEIFWIRSLLTLPAYSKLSEALTKPLVIKRLVSEITNLEKLPYADAIQDGFYRLGILLHFLPVILQAAPDKLGFISNYAYLNIKKYLKNYDIGQKFFNALRLGLEASIAATKANHSNILSYRKLVLVVLNEIQLNIENFQPEHMAPISKIMKDTLRSLKDQREQIKLMELILAFTIKIRSTMSNVLKMVGENNKEKGSNRIEVGASPSRQVENKKKILDSCLALTKSLQESIFQIINEELAHHHKTNFEDNLASNFLNSISEHLARGDFALPSTLQLNNSNKQGHPEEGQANSDVSNYENLLLEIIYKLSKSSNHFIIRDLILNFVTSKYSFKTCLDALKSVKASVNEKRAEKIIIKLLIGIALEVNDEKIFRKTLNELLNFYLEPQETNQNTTAKLYIQKYILKMAKTVKDPIKICVFFGILATNSCTLARENIQKGLKGKHLDVFCWNLKPLIILLQKFITTKPIPFIYEMKVLEKIMDLWVYIIMLKADLDQDALRQCKKLGYLSPNLIHASTGKSYTNFFLIHSFLNETKVIQKYHKPCIQILRASLINVRKKIKHLTLGETVFCMVLDFVIDAKLEQLKLDLSGFEALFKDLSSLDMIIIYLKDIYLNEKVNLQCVMAEVVYQKMAAYIQLVLKLPREQDRMTLIVKDFSTLIQSSCSINVPYMKLSQIFLKEYVRQFPTMIFRREIILITCEVLHQLYKKCGLEYDSVSDVLKVSSPNKHEIFLPTNKKEIANLFFFLVSCVYNMCLRGHLIDHKVVQTKISSVLGVISLKETINGAHVFNFIISTFRVVPLTDNDPASIYPGNWLYDKPAFEKIVENYENKSIGDVWRPIITMPNSSLEMPETKYMLNAFRTYVEYEGAFFHKATIDMYNSLATKPDLSEGFAKLKNSLIRLFIYNNFLHDNTNKVRWTEIVKNSNLKHYLDEEVKSLTDSKISREKIVEFMQQKYNYYLDSVLRSLTQLFNIAQNIPTLAPSIIDSVLNLVAFVPHRNVISVLLKHLTKSLFATLPSDLMEEIIFKLSSFLKKLIHRFNRYSLISNYAVKKASSSNLFKLESEVFAQIKYKELKDESPIYFEIYNSIRHRFGFSDFHSILSSKQPENLEFFDLLSIMYYCETFIWLHEYFMLIVNDLFPLLMSFKLDGIYLYLLLIENFRVNMDAVERFNPETVYLILICNFKCLYLMKNSPYFMFNSSLMTEFYKKTLKLGFYYFARDKNFYIGNELVCTNDLKRVEKRLEIAVLAVKMLRNETYFDSQSVSEAKKHRDNNSQHSNFPQVAFSYRTENKFKTSFTNKCSKYFYHHAEADNKIIGNCFRGTRAIYLSGVQDLSLFLKPLINLQTYEASYFINSKKLLITFIGQELDSIRSFYRQEFAGFRYDFSQEKRVFSDAEYKAFIAIALSISYKLGLFILRKLDYALPSTTQAKLIMSVIDNYHEFCHRIPLALDYYIDYNLKDPQKLKEVFYWDAPQIPTLYKYITYEYETYPLLQIMFSKIMKRLHTEQLLFYLPQVFQSLNTRAAYLISRFLLSYAKKSYLFSHQLIWKSKVESKFEKESINTTTVIPEISRKLLKKTLADLNPTERYIFENVDGFFENITGISGKLQPKWPKPEKKEKIKTLLKEIQTNPYLYIPCNPNYKLEKIKLDSGNPMQSAAKCPILISFYCRKFEGPDKYYEDLLKRRHLDIINHDIRTGSKEIKDEEEEELTVGDEKHGGSIIQDLRETTPFKLFPKKPTERSEHYNQDAEEEKKNVSSDIALRSLREETLNDQADSNHPEMKERLVSKVFEQLVKHEIEQDVLPNINLNPGQLVHQINLSKENASSLVQDQDRTESLIKPAIHHHTITENFHNGKIIEKLMEKSDAQQEVQKDSKNRAEESEYEIISCIFKVFDDIRQDTLALQVIKLFQYIFQTVGLDLYLVPYTTISNRTGSNMDIGGIIEVVPNSISRDQIGKINEYSLYEYFLAKFGREDSPEFQIARENFIKSMAAYSIVSYIIQTKDRHNGNLLIDNVGHLVHIDFGFIFEISPGHNMRFESANFKLNMEMIHIMGHTYYSEPFKFFTEQTIKGFLAIRRYEEHIVNLIKLMTYSGMKCFREKSIQNLKERFFPKCNDLEAGYLMKQIIYDAYNKLTTIIYDDIQALQQNIHRT